MKEMNLTGRLKAGNFKTGKSGIAMLVLLIISAVFIFLSPNYLNNYRINILILILSSAYLAQCWNLMSGYAGQFSFGHAAFFGVGAYTSSILYVTFGITPWIGMLAGMVIAGIIGALIGVLSFYYNLKGDYFALATLAFAEILRVFTNNSKFLHSSYGISILYKKDWRVMQFSSKSGYLYLAFIMLALITFGIYRMQKTRMGLYFVAIRENEDAAKALGINSFKYKMIALVASSMLTALAGTFYAQYYLFIDSHIAFGSTVSIDAIVPCIVGGVGTILGPIIGACIIKPLSTLTNSLLSGYTGMNMVVYGAILVISVIFLPNGVVGLSQKLYGKFKKHNTDLKAGRAKNGMLIKSKQGD